MTPKQWFAVGILGLKNFILAGNLVSLKWLSNPRQLVGYHAETLFLYKTIDNSRGLKAGNVFEVLDGSNEVTIRLGALQSNATWFRTIPSYTQDIASLALLCQLLKPKVVFEIGTATGYTGLHFALNTPDDSQVYTLDLPRGYDEPPALDTTAMDEFQVGMYAQLTDYLFLNSAVEHKITCLFGDSATFDYTPYHGRVDLFFIDGAHSYAYVKSDTLRALECCHSGSVVAWHDFGRAGLNGVSQWLQELSMQYEIFAVPGGSLAFMRVP